MASSYKHLNRSIISIDCCHHGLGILKKRKHNGKGGICKYSFLQQEIVIHVGEKA